MSMGVDKPFQVERALWATHPQHLESDHGDSLVVDTSKKTGGASILKLVGADKTENPSTTGTCTGTCSTANGMEQDSARLTYYGQTALVGSARLLGVANSIETEFSGQQKHKSNFDTVDTHPSHPSLTGREHPEFDLEGKRGVDNNVLLKQPPSSSHYHYQQQQYFSSTGLSPTNFDRANRHPNPVTSEEHQVGRNVWHADLITTQPTLLPAYNLPRFSSSSVTEHLEAEARTNQSPHFQVDLETSITSSRASQQEQSSPHNINIPTNTSHTTPRHLNHSTNSTEEALSRLNMGYSTNEINLNPSTWSVSADSIETMEPSDHLDRPERDNSNRRTARITSACSDVNEGKIREDDDETTVQSFDSTTVSSPNMASVIPVPLELEVGAHHHSLPLGAAMIETPSTVSTAASTDEASLGGGDIYSPERSSFGGCGGGSTLLSPDSLSMPTPTASTCLMRPLQDQPQYPNQHHQQQPHHHRVHSWEESPRTAVMSQYYTSSSGYAGEEQLQQQHNFDCTLPFSLAASPASASAAPWVPQQRLASFRNTHSNIDNSNSTNSEQQQGNRYASYPSCSGERGWQQYHHQQQPQQPQQHSGGPPYHGGPQLPFLPGRGTPPIDNRVHSRSHQNAVASTSHVFHSYSMQQQTHQQHQLPQRKPGSGGGSGYGGMLPQQQQQQQQQQLQVAAITPPRRLQRLPPPQSPHRSGGGGGGSGGGGSGPSGSMLGGGLSSSASNTNARSSSEVLKTLLRKKACLYEPDTSRAVALVTWLVGRELALEFGFFSRQQLQAGVHACVAKKIDSGVITRTKVNRCMQIILNSCFHYIIPRPDGTEESGDSFRASFADEVEDDSYLTKMLPEPWRDVAVDREEVLHASETAAESDGKPTSGSGSTSSSIVKSPSSSNKGGAEFVTPQSSPRLASTSPDKSPGRDSLDGDDGQKRAVLLCFNENVRRAEDVFRCHNEFIRDTAHASHLQLSSQEWRMFFGQEAASTPYLWGNIGIPVPCTEVHGSSHVDALGMMTSEEVGKFRTTWCTKRYDHDHDLCGFAHAEVNDGWLRRNPLGYHYKDEMCPFITTINDKQTGQRLFVINECPLGVNCEFAHSKEEMIYHPRRYKMRACQSTGRPGGCGLGDVCPYFHPVDSYRFPKKSESRSSRHAKYQTGGGKGAPAPPSGAPILLATPAPMSSFEDHLHLPGLRNLYRRQCAVVRAHLRKRGCTCHYSYFGDDSGMNDDNTNRIQDRGLPARH